MRHHAFVPGDLMLEVDVPDVIESGSVPVHT
jgi:hypothetical protein